MNSWTILLAFFSVLGFVMSIIFFFKKGEFNKLFAVLVFMFAYNIFFNVLYWTQLKTKLYAFFHMSYFIPLSLYGGLFYLYLKSITTRRNITKLDSLHFSPLFITLILYSGFYFLKPSIKYKILVEGTSLEYVIHFPYFEQLLVVILAIYTIAIYQKFKNIFQDDKEMQNWVRYVIFAFIGFTLSFIAYEVLMLTNILKVEHDYIITICSAIFIGVISYLVYVYPAIFNGKSIQEVLPFVKYKKTGLGKEESLKLKKDLITIIESEKPYLNCDLRLVHLAKMLNIPRHHTSQVINEHFDTNFFDFINQYRVSESVRLIKEDKSHHTMESIAYQSGFNNRVSFYKAFKKYKGVTPTVFKEQNS
ncbi:MAG: helix-turn-helix domain-containing protein [Flavobacteriaceae bacterium]